MKSVLKIGSKHMERPFPKLMVSSETGNIVLFIEEERGTWVYLGAGNENYTIGIQGDCFDMDNFSDFEGTLELSND